MNLSTFTARAGAVLVALIAGFASFRHIVGVAIHFGEDRAVAYALPFCIDALMLVSVAAMAEDKMAGRKPRTSARVAFAFGVLASLGANIASADPTLGARIVAAVPALALLLAIEVLSRTGKAKRDDITLADQVPDVVDVINEVPLPRSDSDVITIRSKRRSAAAAVAKVAARMPDASPVAIAAKVGVSEATARRHMRALTVGTTGLPVTPERVTVPAVVTAEPARSNGHHTG